MTRHARGAIRLAGFIALLVAGVGNVNIHVKYMTPGSDPVEVAAFLPVALTDPLNPAVLGTGGVGVAVASVAYLRF